MPLISLSRPVAAAVVAAGLLVAGCGGGGGADKNDYVKHVNQAIASLQKSLTDVGNVAGSGDVNAAAGVLDRGGVAMDKAAKDFEGLTPPSDAKQANAKIADGLHKLAGSFHDMAKQARAKDLQGLSQSLTAFQDSEGAQEIQKAQDELTAAGYKISG